MTSIVYNGVTYGGTSLVSFVGSQVRFAFRVVRGLDDTPEVRGTDTIIPSAAGRVARNRVRDRRVIELQGLVVGTGSTDAAQVDDFRDAMETLRDLFDPTDAAKTLIVSLEDATRTATISARPINMVVGSDAIPILREVSVELEAVGADWVIA